MVLGSSPVAVTSSDPKLQQGPQQTSKLEGFAAIVNWDKGLQEQQTTTKKKAAAKSKIFFYLLFTYFYHTYNHLQKILEKLRKLIKSCHRKQNIKGTLTQIWKSANIFVFIWKYVEDFILKHLLLSEICARELYEKFVYKHSETIAYVKNWPTF